MLIKSVEGGILFWFGPGCYISYEEMADRFNIFGYSSAYDDAMFLGAYRTEERAKEVIDEIYQRTNEDTFRMPEKGATRPFVMADR